MVGITIEVQSKQPPEGYCCGILHWKVLKNYTCKYAYSCILKANNTYALTTLLAMMQYSSTYCVLFNLKTQ